MKENLTIKTEKNHGKKELRNLILKSSNIYALKTIYNNNGTRPYNMRIINKKKANKREEMLNILNKSNPHTFFSSSVSPQSKSPYHNKYIDLNTISSKSSKRINHIFNVQHFILPDKEHLVAELYHINNDMEIQNKELEDLKNNYNNCIRNSLVYKSILEKIINSDKSGIFINNDKNENYINSDNTIYNLKYRAKSKSENNFNRIKTIVEEKDESLPTKTMYSNQKIYKNNTTNNFSYLNIIKNYKKSKSKSKLILKNNINLLEKQKADLNRIFIDKERHLIKIKNDKKNKIFDEYLSMINEKNNELEILVIRAQKLRFKRHETDNLLNLYYMKIKKYIDEINSINDKIVMNKKDLEIIKKDIESLLKCKEELKQKKLQLNKNVKQNKNNFKEKQKKENEIDNLLNEKKKYFEEQGKIESQIRDLKKKEDNIKKSVDKCNLKIKGIKRDNEDLIQQIKYYEERRNKLLEKADRPRKNRIRMKEMENEIKDLEKIIVTYKVENDEKETNMRETIVKNNETIVNLETEINNHIDIVKDLETKINMLKDELKKFEENNNKVSEELLKLEGEYNNIQEQRRQEKETKEKMKKEKEMELQNEEMKKNKEFEEFYNEYIKNKKELSEENEKLKIANNQIIEENKKLKDTHKEKMELYKSIQIKKAKLEKLLDEIKELSDQEQT